ncbi:MAG: glycosyltransferase [Flavobacteriales bacterium]|nr:glycosyltransferase [Flavobacteriales bacterium]
MITLVSYPRSGNTFLRNVLFEVYGVSSKTYLTDGHGPDQAWNASSVVKTHHLPDNLPTALLDRPIVYLIRDGRDAVVSFAHHRKDVVAPESDFNQNLKEAVYAAEGSHFGGWSAHVEAWLPKAAVVIRFEDLIKDPITACEKIAKVMSLPAPAVDRLPDFKGLKQGTPEYGSGKYTHDGALAQHWFRKGVVGGWREELSEEMARLFWHLHGETMEWVGYQADGAINALPDLKRASVTKVLMEGSKLNDPFIDGIGRYVREVLKASERYPDPRIDMDVMIENRIVGMREALEHVAVDARKRKGAFQLLKSILRFALPDATYEWLARAAPLTRMPKFHNPRVSNDSYDVAWLSLPQNYIFLQSTRFLKLVATVHDLTHQQFAQFHEANNIQRTEEGMQWIDENHGTCIAVSQSTQSDLLKEGIHAVHIPEGVDRRIFFPIPNAHLKALVRKRYALPEGPFLLSVSTIEPRKNIQGLIDAYAAMDPLTRKRFPLVLAGRKGWRSKLEIPEDCAGQIHFTGFVREEHLPALYTLAHGFCYVSLYEGFGLPVLEAMACGCPVLVSDRASLPELVGEVGILCDPESKASIAEGLRQLIQINRAEAQGRLMRQTWEFTWRDCWLRSAHLLVDGNTVPST